MFCANSIVLVFSVPDDTCQLSLTQYCSNDCKPMLTCGIETLQWTETYAGKQVAAEMGTMEGKARVK
jgi:hypothetical protein